MKALYSCAHLLLIPGVPFLIVGVRVSEAGATTVEETVRAFYLDNVGATYQWGACEADRLDCSCFAQRFYQERYGVNIGRTTEIQVRLNAWARLPGFEGPDDLEESRLCPGDLVYTWIGASWETGTRHVAIYMGDGRIAHASENRGGVAEDDLSFVKPFSLQGVYRILPDCHTQTPSMIRPAARPEVDQNPEIRIRRVIHRLFEAMVRLDFDAWRSCWHEDAIEAAGRNDVFSFRHYEAIMDERWKQFSRLQEVEEKHTISSVSIRGDQALVEVISTIDFVYLDGRTSHIRDQHQSFLLTRKKGQWRISYSEAWPTNDPPDWAKQLFLLPTAP